MTTLNAEKRDMKNKAKKLRREGFVIGNLNGRDLESSLPIQIPVLEAERFMKKNMKGSRTVLQIGDKKINAIVKDVDYNPILKKIMFIDFQTLVKGEKITATAQVVLVNEELAKGCVDEELSEIQYKAEPEDLIEKVEIDFSKLGDKKSVKVKDLKEFQNDKITLITSEEALVVSLEEASVLTESEEEVAEAAPIAG